MILCSLLLYRSTTRLCVPTEGVCCAGDDWNRCCRLQRSLLQNSERSLLQRGEEMRADQRMSYVQSRYHLAC